LKPFFLKSQKKETSRKPKYTKENSFDIGKFPYSIGNKHLHSWCIFHPIMLQKSGEFVFFSNSIHDDFLTKMEKTFNQS